MVLGFGLEDKSWHEFAVSSIRDITWDETAFNTLVLPDEYKRHVKALVASRGKGPGDNDDDVIEGQSSVNLEPRRLISPGKGRGIVVALIRPPWVGKTLTAEAVAELLHKPLYVSLFRRLYL